MTLSEKETHWVEEFMFIPDPQERLSAIQSRANKRHGLTDEEKAQTPRIPGCVSAVWILGTKSEAGCCLFRCDADSPMVKGLVALLCDFYDGESAMEIRTHESQLINRLGFHRILTPTRLNGLQAVASWIRTFAATD